MNKERRERITKCIQSMVALQEELGGIECEEQEAFDNTPESLQATERGEAMEEAISQLQDAVSGLQDIINELETIA